MESVEVGVEVTFILMTDSVEKLFLGAHLYSLLDFQIGNRISTSMVRTTDDIMTAANAALGM